MRKLLFRLLIPFFFVACSNDENSSPTITFIKIEGVKESTFVGDEYSLTISYSPEDADIPECSWVSANTDIISINSEGKIKALKEGTATVIVSLKEQKFSSSVSITVLPISATSLKLDRNAIECTTNEEFTLSYKIEPDSTTHKVVTWKSSDENIATVSNNGVVKTISEGKVTVTASLGTLKDECKIEVKPAGISLNYLSTNIVRLSKLQLEVNFRPANTKNKKVTWKSSNENIASVDALGEVTANSLGTAIITAIANEGGFEAKCEVTVVPIAVSGIYVITKDGKRENNYPIDLLVNSDYLIKYEIEPINADNKGIMITSSNTNIAYCENNVIKAKNIGTANITLKTADGAYIATYVVNVKDIDHFVSIDLGSPSAVTTTNGLVTGSVTLTISNYNNIILSGVKIGVRHYDQSNPAMLYSVDNIPAIGVGSYNLSFSSINKPVFIVKFTANGKEYTIEKNWPITN